MCAIVGALVNRNLTKEQSQEAQEIFRHLMISSSERGRDGVGWQGKEGDTLFSVRTAQRDKVREIETAKFPHGSNSCSWYIANLRAEPTTEYVEHKSPLDQQPYSLDDWSIVHNGTIANDKELRTNRVNTTIDSAAIVEQLVETNLLFNRPVDSYSQFHETLSKLVGSYAIIGGNRGHNDTLFLGLNYRPIWYLRTSYGVFFSSSEEYFPSWAVAEALTPYHSAMFSFETGQLIIEVNALASRKPQERKKALVIASGGLDSTVAAAKCVADGYKVKLAHFAYGCKAEWHETEAIGEIANYLGVEFEIYPMGIYNESDSPLLSKDPDSHVSAGEAGSEYAHEWVPARNLVMLSLATAMAESGGYDCIVLGNNLEEAGAYPDNEPEFIKRFNKVLPFAVGDGKSVQVEMPVGNLMKHEIVALGHQLNAPMHLTWSCYRNGDKHCGRCGPCFMRKTAFRINNLQEVIEYEV